MDRKNPNKKTQEVTSQKDKRCFFHEGSDWVGKGLFWGIKCFCLFSVQLLHSETRTQLLTIVIQPDS